MKMQSIFRCKVPGTVVLRVERALSLFSTIALEAAFSA